MAPTLLTDKTRLQEIYNLRVTAWENSENKIFVNREVFPNGWKDQFDDDAHHWIIEVENKIIASARLCIVNSIDLADEDFSQFDLPDQRPFAFYSRLVVLPEFRGRGISQLMDVARVRYLKDKKIKFAISDVEEHRLKALYSLGFKKVGLLRNSYGIGAEMVTTVIVLKSTDIQLQ